jgi:polygalacturonase
MSNSTKSFSVLDFGAVADGLQLNTAAIASAIQTCAASGGGRVFFPAGAYLTGPIELKSHVELHVEEGATVLFSRNFDDYPLCVTNFEGQQTVTCRPPLWGRNLRNIAITGKGSFNGQGEAWRPVKKMKMADAQWEELRRSGGVIDDQRHIWWPSLAALEGERLVRRLRASRQEPRIEDYRPARDFLRPNMVQLVECRDVLLDGPTFENSACWNVHLLLCEHVVVRNCTVLNPWYAQNGDGLDIESCRNVLIKDCHVDVGDDAICLKSGKDEEGRRRGRPCENITIRNCKVLHGHGGVTIGSEMSGGVRNVKVLDCEFRGTDVGLRFKTCRGRGGVVEDIEIQNVAMADIKGAAISFDMYYGGTAWGEGPEVKPHPEPLNEGTPRFRNVRMSNITCAGARRAVELRGLPEMPIEGITLENAHLTAREGVYITEAQEITLRDVHVETPDNPAIRCHNAVGLCMEQVDVCAPEASVEPARSAPVPSFQLTGKTTVNGHAA